MLYDDENSTSLLDKRDKFKQKCQSEDLPTYVQKFEILPPAHSLPPHWEKVQTEDYSELNSRKLLIAAGGRPVALMLAFGVVMMPILAAGNTPVALVLAISVGVFLVISSLRFAKSS